MTDKVRRRLVYKYTAIIAVMLLFFAVGGFAMCIYAVQKVIADTMYDAVAAGKPKTPGSTKIRR